MAFKHSGFCYFTIGTVWGKWPATWAVIGLFSAAVVGLIAVVTASHTQEITPLVLSLFAVAFGIGVPIVIARRVRLFGIKRKWRFRAGVSVLPIRATDGGF